MANKNLHNAKVAKKDEFYTRLEDIANELNHYRDFFRGKSVLCNCDDPYESNFFKFFALNFNGWGLHKLVATCYDGSPVAGSQLQLSFLADEEPEVTNILKEPEAVYERKSTDGAPRPRVAYKIEITEVPDMNSDGATDMADVDILIRNRKNVLTRLNGNGDFRSAECMEMLKQADVVVTNPPFSLFREYVAQLVEHDKKFLILGNKNALTYREIFPLIMEDRLWTGATPMSKEFYFSVPQSYIDDGLLNHKDRSIVKYDGKYVHRSQSIWFTNIDHKKRHEPLDLYRTYRAEEYPTYDNYDAINVDKTADIPMDYDGVMGVPITFLDKYSPEQFEIIGIDRYVEDNPRYGHRFTIKGKETYARILIKRKQQ